MCESSFIWVVMLLRLIACWHVGLCRTGKYDLDADILLNELMQLGLPQGGRSSPVHFSAD